ncbi:MAG TPA: hypothetical protein PK772_06315 [Chitinophagaceae bacterium]|nr:hypothetical protein [Chitinophagaceae bacterium]
MSKLSKHFEFDHPVIETRVVNGRPTKIHSGDLIVKGIGYKDTTAQLYSLYPDDHSLYDVDIKNVYWDGVDISSLVHNKCDDLLYELHESAIRYITGLFSFESLQDQKTSELVDAQMQSRA